MELIKPSVEIWEQGSTLEDMWKHIARCTRVCYQSTPKNDGETDEEFVKRVILRTNSSTGELDWNKIHGAMLEHGTVYLNCPNISYSNMLGSKYTQSVYDETNHQYCITTNLRVLAETGNMKLLDEAVLPTLHKRRVTVSFTTNIGVTREFNRHRVDSIAEESTRYCNYNKRQDGEIKIGLPAWIKDENCPEEYIRDLNNMSIAEYCTDFVDNDTDVSDIWDEWCYYFFALKACEFAYNSLISKGWKPQQAREVLPLATKSQLIHTAFVDDWRHFFALRADGVSGPPHPNAKLVATPLKQEFIKHNLL